MADTATRSFQPDSDVHITFEDQQKINLFARQNAKLDDCKVEIACRQNELQNLEDAVEEIMMQDACERIPFLSGDIFLYLTPSDTEDALQKAKNKVESEIEEIKSTMEGLKNSMSELKKHLYGKFGSHINLDGDDE